ncbi:chorismate mutase [Streptomyces palmae]|uniref:Chorismate mutase n=1 Tax=Streptomyces palmae TaxID=1701085 RepID=A0A4Z0G851_9ACTN|nr:chorismate mutase [Streptomyces palmae]TGA91866.1 chorismate mutase [Streptomyces palmae]
MTASTAPTVTPDTLGEADAPRSGRGAIDELDRRIIALIEERMSVSADIQRDRLAAGGRRLDLSREMEILRRYQEPLGKPGTTLAMTLLELCRGRV